MVNQPQKNKDICDGIITLSIAIPLYIILFFSIYSCIYDPWINITWNKSMCIIQQESIIKT